MRSLVVEQGDGGLLLAVEERPVPVPGRGEVLVAVRAAGLVGGELDWPTTWRAPLGHARVRPVPGREVAGSVVALGPGAVGLSRGDRVFGWVEEGREGAFSDFVCARPEHLAPMPDDMGWVEAAGLPFAGAAAWQALFEHGRAAARDTVAVVGARTPTGRQTLRLGTDSFLEMITSDAWRGRRPSRQLARVSLVVDTVGGGELRDAVRHVGDSARVVSTHDAPPGDGLYFVPLVDRPRLNLLAQNRETGSPAGAQPTVVSLLDAPVALPPLLGSDTTKVVVVPRPLPGSALA